MIQNRPITNIASAPMHIIDGDRGKNYPKHADFGDAGHCLFLNTGNVTKHGFDFDQCQFITEEKDSALRKGKLQRGDVIMTTRGTIGNVAHYSAEVPFEHVRINSGMVIFRTNREALSDRFLFQYLRSRSFRKQIESLRTGAAQPQLPIRDIKTIGVPIPPITTQLRIAGLLSAYDDLIEHNRRRIALLEQAARELYREWFVRLRFPGHESARVVDGLPKEWETRTLGEVADIRGGKQFGGEELDDSHKYPVFGGNGIQRYSSKSTHTGFVIVFGRVGVNCGSIHWSYDGGWVNNNASSIVPRYFNELVLQHLLHYDFSHLRKGAAQPFIPNGLLSTVRLVIPRKELSVQYCNLVLGIRIQQTNLHQQTRDLARARDLLLPRLMSGEVPG